MERIENNYNGCFIIILGFKHDAGHQSWTSFPLAITKVRVKV